MGSNSKVKSVTIAIESVEMRNDLSQKDKAETISVLNNILGRDWFMTWDKESIIETLYEYKSRTGVSPTVTNLLEPGMPKSLTIRNHFGISAASLLKQLFPDSSTKTRRNRYGFNSVEDWMNCFRKQFDEKMDGCVGGNMYNSLRDSNTPTWYTIACHCGISTWSELMNAAGVKYRNTNKHRYNEVYICNATSKIAELLDEQNKKRERLLNDLLSEL